jgi:B-cell receptor-associated protein 31
MVLVSAGFGINLTGIQITFIFILILFVDSVNRVYRVQVELSGMGNNNGNS